MSAPTHYYGHSSCLDKISLLGGQKVGPFSRLLISREVFYLLSRTTRSDFDHLLALTFYLILMRRNRKGGSKNFVQFVLTLDKGIRRQFSSNAF